MVARSGTPDTLGRGPPMEAPTVRAVACATVAALFPTALWQGVALPPEGSGLPGGVGGVTALVLLSATSLAIFAGFRLRSGLDGPGLLAALLFSCSPPAVDAAGSPLAGKALWVAFGAAALLPVLALAFRGSDGSAARAGFHMISALCFALTFFTTTFSLRGGALLYGAAALLPSLPLALAVAMECGDAATAVLRRMGGEGASRGKAWILAGLLVVLPLTLEIGVSFRRAGTWSSPAAFWERALRESPGSPAALGALAREKAGGGDLGEAAALLRRFAEAVEKGGAEDLRGEDARREGGEGAATAALSILRSTGGDREAAVAAVAAARRLAPSSARVLLVVGEARLAEGSLSGAIEALDEAVQRDPALGPAWDALARARIASGRLEEGLEAAVRATGLDPKRGAFARTLAEALLCLDRGPEALRLLRESLGTPPYEPVQGRAYADAHGRLARREISRNNRGRARRLLAAGLQVDPANAGCQELRASLEAAFEKEKPEYEMLIRPGSDGTVNPDNLLLYAVWLCRWGDFERAEPYFRTLVARCGGNPLVHYHMGREFWEGRGTVEGYEKAVDAYRDALARDPGNIDARDALWQALRVLGRDGEARAEARRFIDVAGAHPDTFDAEKFLQEPVVKR